MLQLALFYVAPTVSIIVSSDNGKVRQCFLQINKHKILIKTAEEDHIAHCIDIKSCFDTFKHGIEQYLSSSQVINVSNLIQ